MVETLALEIRMFVIAPGTRDFIEPMTNSAPNLSGDLDFSYLHGRTN